MAHNINVQFGKAVRRLRKKAGISQETLAERAGLHWTFVARVERAEVNLSLASVGKIARALKIKLAKLVKDIH